jgi:cytochrome d ubiquinol oxidase subunit I
VPDNRLFLWFAASAGVLTYIAVEAGWIVTEVGRQPWIVYNIMRTEDAVTATGAGTLWISFTAIAVLYLSLAVGTVTVLRAMSRRWRDTDHTDDDLAVYGPRPAIDDTEVLR